MSNLADSVSNDSDSNGEFEQLLPPVSITPQASTQPPSTSSERDLRGSPVSTRASPPVTLSHSMASETYLDEPAATSKREADSSAQACGCCCYCMLQSIYIPYYSPESNCLLCQLHGRLFTCAFLLFLTPLAACVTNMDPRGMFTWPLLYLAISKTSLIFDCRVSLNNH